MEATTGEGSEGGVADDRLSGAAGRTMVAALVGFGTLFAITFWGLLIRSAYAGAYGDPSPVVLYAIGYLGTGLGTATVAWAYLSWTDRGFDYLDLRVPSLRDLAWTVAGVVGLLVLLYGIGALFSYAGVEQSSHGLVTDARANPAILLVAIPASWLVIGPGEELVFRNLVQKSLYDAFSRPAAVLVATVIFAAVHFSAYWGQSPLSTLASLLSVFVLALVLGVVYERTESLVVSALVHGTFNAVQFADLYCDLTACGIAILP